MNGINKIIEINKNVMENLKRTQEVLLEEIEKVNFNLERMETINNILSSHPADTPNEKGCNRNHNHNHNHNHHTGRPHDMDRINRNESCEKKCRRNNNNSNNENYKIEFSIPMIEIDDIYDLDENEDLLESLLDYLDI